MSAIEKLNAMDADEASDGFFKCCGSARWAREMTASRPFANWPSLLAKAREIWLGLAETDWLQAFGQHPKIGDAQSLAKKFPSTRTWSENEQAGVQSARIEVLEALARANQDYERRFGFIFIVCATGKSAPEMLAILQNRLQNSRERELENAALEQAKITELRLEKWL